MKRRDRLDASGMRKRGGGVLWATLAAFFAAAAAGAAAEGAAVSGPAPATRPRIAVVIDDFGLTYPKNEPDEAWMRLPIPMTFAVMPESPRTKKAAARTRAAGKELIIHFPFDPFLSLDLDKDEATEADKRKVRGLIEKAFREIPGAVGMNNHRSYKATLNRPLMRWFMGEIKSRGIYFIDSKVSPRSVAYDEARRAGIKAARNLTFLEEPGHYRKEFTARMLRVAAAYARKHGSALAIGHHYYRGTFDGIADEAPKLQKEGFEFVFASELVR